MAVTIIPIESKTEQNTNFREVLVTSKNMQLVVMNLLPSEDIGTEVHQAVDQFFRIESGEVTVMLNSEQLIAKAGDAFIVPMGTQHNIINRSAQNPVKLYTIYSPPNHPDHKIHQTKADAQADENDHA